MKPTINEKTVAVISHIFILGWIIGFVLNLNSKSEFTSFYLRQTVIPHLVLLLVFTTFIGKLFSILAFVILVMSLFAYLSGDKTKFPIVGDYFQSWFKSI